MNYAHKYISNKQTSCGNRFALFLKKLIISTFNDKENNVNELRKINKRYCRSFSSYLNLKIHKKVDSSTMTFHKFKKNQAVFQI